MVMLNFFVRFFERIEDPKKTFKKITDLYENKYKISQNIHRIGCTIHLFKEIRVCTYDRENQEVLGFRTHA